MLLERTPSREDIRRHQLLLRELQEDFARLNRRTVSVSLRSSMITRIGEIQGYVNNGLILLEKEARRTSAKSKRQQSKTATTAAAAA